MRQASHLASGAMGAAVMAAVLLLAGAAPHPGTMPVIDTQRINIREPDGTLRMVLSGAAAEPGIIVDGHEQPHPSRRSAGILFYNDEGTENGGLVFDGRRDRDGIAHSSGSLTFDRYRQDQMVQITADEDGRDRHAGIVVNDQPDAPFDFAAIDRARSLPPAQRLAAMRAAHAGGTRRLFAGREEDGSSVLQLRDAAGTTRLLVKVAPDGAAAIQFLDTTGRPTRTITP